MDPSKLAAIAAAATLAAAAAANLFIGLAFFCPVKHSETGAGTAVSFNPYWLETVCVQWSVWHLPRDLQSLYTHHLLSSESRRSISIFNLSS